MNGLVCVLGVTVACVGLTACLDGGVRVGLVEGYCEAHPDHPGCIPGGADAMADGVGPGPGPGPDTGPGPGPGPGPAVCTDGARRCAGDIVEACVSGAWQTVKQCLPPTPDCAQAQCVASPCRSICPPTNGCGPDGCGGTCGSCPPDHSCVAGSCWLTGCEADCATKTCGDDGCGGLCGQCVPGSRCEAGRCVCVPDCAGKKCGEDGCGGSCGACSAGHECQGGHCICKPQCANKACGPDGCGGSCGVCPAGHHCGDDGKCHCQPVCDGKTCGPDGCGGSCGACPAGHACISGACTPDPNAACGGDENVEVWSVGLNYLHSTLTDCGLKCYWESGTEACLLTCISDKLGTNKQCTACYADLVACAIDKCLGSCASGISVDACLDCLDSHGCVEVHQKCSGGAPI